jgi:DNA-directed RNA polymerase subunit D
MIRRSILNKVKTMAMEEIDLHKNTSAMYNENLAHRLGLIPLTFEDKAYNLRENCKCKGKGCSKCQVILTLNKKGPCTVYAGDLKSTDQKVVPSDKDIIIIKLLEGQEIKLDGIARLGSGGKHSRWQPAIVGYQYYPELKITKDCNLCKECEKACPKELVKLIKSKKKFSLIDSHKCNLCNACAKACPKDALKVEGDESRIIVTVESISSISPRKIVLNATEIINEELAELKKLTK